jgi:hypothetical protein
LLIKKEWGELCNPLELSSLVSISPHSFNQVTKDQIEFYFALIKVLVNVTILIT